MITDVAQAIGTRYNEDATDPNALRAVLTGGLWFTQAEDDVSFPYGVFTWDGSAIDEIAGTRLDGLETALITVSLFSNADDGSTEMFDIIMKFIKVFDWTTLTYPGGSELSHIKMQRMSIANRGIVDKILQYDLNYEVQYNH
jgi:hypothetical protein